MPKAATSFYGARKVVAQVAFQALLLMLTDTSSSAVEAELLACSVLADAIPHTDPAAGLIDVVHANSFTTAALALVFLLAMRAHIAATTLSAASEPLQMHALDRHRSNT